MPCVSASARVHTARPPPPPPPPLPQLLQPHPGHARPTEAAIAGPRTGLTKVSAAGAKMSSRYHDSLWAADAAIDGDLSSFCATSNEQNAWVSVKLATAAIVAQVQVYNRADQAEYQAWLGPFEVWLGASYGDTSERTAKRCGHTVIVDKPSVGPFRVTCDAVSSSSFVTLKQVGSARYLTPAEISVYTAQALHGYPAAQTAQSTSPLAAVVHSPSQGARASSPPQWQQPTPTLTGRATPPPSVVPPLTLPPRADSLASPGSGAAAAASTATRGASGIKISFSAATCRSITLSWSVGVVRRPSRYALFYSPASLPAAERAWSTGLRDPRATVTGLLPGAEYSFRVASSSLTGDAAGVVPEWGARSEKLLARTPLTCEAPKDAHDPGCHVAHVEEAHRLGAPLVNALSCTALVLELPPLPPDHCDEDPHQRIAIEATIGGSSRWLEIRPNVLSPTLILGGLTAVQTYECVPDQSTCANLHVAVGHLPCLRVLGFVASRMKHSYCGLALHVLCRFRTVLRRPTLGDRISESSGLVVVEAGSANATIRSAPTASIAHRAHGSRVIVVSWRVGAGTCRVGSAFSLQAADATHAARWSEDDRSQLSWRTVVQNVTASEVEVAFDALSGACHRLCSFRLLPMGVAGWHEPTQPSFPLDLHGTTSPPWLVVLLVLFASMATVIIAFEAIASGLPVQDALRDADFWRGLWGKANLLWRDTVDDLMANATWLSRAWLDGLSYDRTTVANDVDSEDRQPLNHGDELDDEVDTSTPTTAANSLIKESLDTDEYAPLALDAQDAPSHLAIREQAEANDELAAHATQRI